MCSQGVHGGALRCPLYARDLPRGELVQTLKSQFIRPGFELYVPPDILDEQKWTIDEISVFFQSGGSVKPRHAIIAEAERLVSGEAPPQPTESASTLGTPVGGAGRGGTGFRDLPPFGRIQAPVAASAAVREGATPACEVSSGGEQGEAGSGDEFAGQWGF